MRLPRNHRTLTETGMAIWRAIPRLRSDRAMKARQEKVVGLYNYRRLTPYCDERRYFIAWSVRPEFAFIRRGLALVEWRFAFFGVLIPRVAWHVWQREPRSEVV